MEEKPTAGSAGRTHETREANIKNVMIFGAGLLILIAFGLVASVGVFHYFAGRQTLGPPASPFEDVRTLPPVPRLQVAPEQDLGRYLADQEQELTTYGWADRQSGAVRIPIDRAMDLLLKKGLPVRGAGSQPATARIKPGEVDQTVPQGYTPR